MTLKVKLKLSGTYIMYLFLSLFFLPSETFDSSLLIRDIYVVNSPTLPLTIVNTDIHTCNNDV